jgi:predicted helicase
MVEYRPYQKEIIKRGSEVLREHGFVYLAMEVRTGKTLTSLGIAEEVGAENVLFLTKKKAISSITNDSNMLCPSYVSISYPTTRACTGCLTLGGT